MQAGIGRYAGMYVLLYACAYLCMQVEMYVCTHACMEGWRDACAIFPRPRLSSQMRRS